VILQVLRNELVYSIEPSDITFECRRVTIRAGARDIYLVIRFDPPHGIVIERGQAWHNGLRVDISADGVRWPGGGGLSGLTLAEAMVGVRVGRGPSVPTGFYVPVLASDYQGPSAPPEIIVFAGV